MEINEEVVIVGAGIAGLATAVALQRIGIRSLVLERAEELRTTGAALTLYANAWRALDALGVSSKLTSIYDASEMVYAADMGTGEVQKVFFVKPGSKSTKYAPRPVHRKALLEALAEELPSDWIRFSSKLVSIDQTPQVQGGGSLVTIRLEDGATIRSKVLIGCDGVNSMVAEWLGLAAAVHSGRCAVRGLSFFPEGHGQDGVIRQYLGTGKRGAYASANPKEFYWFLISTSSADGKKLTRDPEKIKEEVLEHLAKDFPSTYKEVVEHSDMSSLSWAPLMYRYPWDIAFGTLGKGGVTVAGDAMHPMTPDIGQGGCAALEDAVILGRHIGGSYLKNGNKLVVGEIGGVLGEYTKERRWRSVSMVTKSYIAGWLQQSATSGNWLEKFLRNGAFARYLWRKLAAVGSFDCGELPRPASPTYHGLELDPQSSKMD